MPATKLRGSAEIARHLSKSADENYLKGAIILEWNNHGNGQLPATGPKSQGAAA